MYCLSSENYQGLIDLLHSEDCTLSKVIEDPGFTTALRNDSPDLINFLTQKEELDIITQFALSAEIEETVDPIEYKKMMRHSMTILTSSSRKLQNFLISNDRYLLYLRSFPSTRSINSAILCANYAKIIDFLISFSQGKFVEAQYPNLIDILIDYIDNLSFQMLFVKICCDHYSNFNLSYDLMKKLIESPKNVPKIYTLTKIVNDKSALIPFLNVPEILQPLYELVVQTYQKSDFLCTETCNLLLIIIKATQPNDLAHQYELEYGQRIDFELPLNYSSAAILSLFPKYVDHFIDRFFANEDKCTTQVNQSILEALRKKSKVELQKIAFEHDIFMKIMNFYPSYVKRKVNGHFFQIVQLFVTNQIECPSREHKEWTSFIQTKFAERYQSVYGGRSLKDFLVNYSQPELESLPTDKLLFRQNVYSSEPNANRFRPRCQSHQNMAHIPSCISSSTESSSSSADSSSGSEYEPHINISTQYRNGKPPATPNTSHEKKFKKFNISRIPNAHAASSQNTSSSSSIILIDSSVINQQHHQLAVNPIKLEVTAEVVEAPRDPENDRKLMSRSLDPNTMRAVTSRFNIRIEPRNPDKPPYEHNS
ncbi:hypothetical protein M9Y10_025418 [Tritrichomonas musculus]|uniref:Uncharacterized protein n=1 Tax=Tritrichomonas musculus TaxID=1915356 RepID=A0ABR2H8R2_9EUKA